MSNSTHARVMDTCCIYKYIDFCRNRNSSISLKKKMFYVFSIFHRYKCYIRINYLVTNSLYIIHGCPIYFYQIYAIIFDTNWHYAWTWKFIYYYINLWSFFSNNLTTRRFFLHVWFRAKRSEDNIVFTMMYFFLSLNTFLRRSDQLIFTQVTFQ